MLPLASINRGVLSVCVSWRALAQRQPRPLIPITSAAMRWCQNERFPALPMDQARQAHTRTRIRLRSKPTQSARKRSRTNTNSPLVRGGERHVIEDRIDGLVKKWSPTRKLTYAQMDSIRFLFKEIGPPTYTYVTLGQKFGVSRLSIMKILKSSFNPEEDKRSKRQLEIKEIVTEKRKKTEERIKSFSVEGEELEDSEKRAERRSDGGRQDRNRDRGRDRDQGGRSSPSFSARRPDRGDGPPRRSFGDRDGSSFRSPRFPRRDDGPSRFTRRDAGPPNRSFDGPSEDGEKPSFRSPRHDNGPPRFSRRDDGPSRFTRRDAGPPKRSFDGPSEDGERPSRNDNGPSRFTRRDDGPPRRSFKSSRDNEEESSSRPPRRDDGPSWFSRKEGAPPPRSFGGSSDRRGRGGDSSSRAPRYPRRDNAASSSFSRPDSSSDRPSFRSPRSDGPPRRDFRSNDSGSRDGPPRSFSSRPSFRDRQERGQGDRPFSRSPRSEGGTSSRFQRDRGSRSSSSSSSSSPDWRTNDLGI